MESTQRRKPRQSESRIRRRDAWYLLAMGGVAFLVGLSGLAYVAGSLRAGVFDARPEGSPRDAPPVYVYASDHPVEFYGDMLFLAALTLGMLYLGVEMMREAHKESRSENGEGILGARLRRRRR